MRIFHDGIEIVLVDKNPHVFFDIMDDLLAGSGSEIKIKELKQGQFTYNLRAIKLLKYRLVGLRFLIAVISASMDQYH